MKKRIFGYARISTVKQSIERQIRNIKDIYPEAVIVTEEYTGTSMNRPEWSKLYKKLQAGDTVVFDSVSRMSRDAAEGFEVYQELYNKGVNLIFIKEPHINTATYKQALESGIQMTGTAVDCILEGVNKYLMELAREQIRLAFDQAEKEVEDLRQRTREGIETARLNGKQIGQKPGSTLNVKKVEPIKQLIRKYSKDFDGTLDDNGVLAVLSAKRVTYKTGRKVEKKDANGETVKDKSGRPVMIDEEKEVSAKLARNTYYKYKKEMKGGK